MLAQQLFAVVCLLITLSTAQQVVIHNWCPFDVYGWHVLTGGPAPERFMLPRGQWSMNAAVRWEGGNPTIKLANSPYLVSPESGLETLMLQVEYGYSNDRLVYDLSFVNCRPFEQCPFSSRTHVLETSASDCPAAGCSWNELACRGGYQWDKDDTKTHTCLDSTKNIITHLCMEHAPSGYYPGFDVNEMDDRGVTINNKRPTPCDKYFGQSSLSDGAPWTQECGCEQWHRVQPGDSCLAVQARYGIDWMTFHQWNPTLGENCQLLVIGNAYCVKKARAHVA